VEGYRFSTEVRVRFAETDAQAIAHHASFLVWLEVARIAYLAEHAGGYRAIQEQGFEALTTAVEVRYHRAARFDDTLRVWARCVDLRGARFRFEYLVERDGEPIAEASTSHATVDAATHRPVRLPTSFLEAVARAEAAPESSASWAPSRSASTSSAQAAASASRGPSEG
jgi:acyl-CoA thioester hydrolase